MSGPASEATVAAPADPQPGLLLSIPAAVLHEESCLRLGACRGRQPRAQCTFSVWIATSGLQVEAGRQKQLAQGPLAILAADAASDVASYPTTATSRAERPASASSASVASTPGSEGGNGSVIVIAVGDVSFEVLPDSQTLKARAAEHVMWTCCSSSRLCVLPRCHTHLQPALPPAGRRADLGVQHTGAGCIPECGVRGALPHRWAVMQRQPSSASGRRRGELVCPASNWLSAPHYRANCNCPPACSHAGRGYRGRGGRRAGGGARVCVHLQARRCCVSPAALLGAWPRHHNTRHRSLPPPTQGVAGAAEQPRGGGRRGGTGLSLRLQVSHARVPTAAALGGGALNPVTCRLSAGPPWHAVCTMPARAWRVACWCAPTTEACCRNAAVDHATLPNVTLCRRPPRPRRPLPPMLWVASHVELQP